MAIHEAASSGEYIYEGKYKPFICLFNDYDNCYKFLPNKRIAKVTRHGKIRNECSWDNSENYDKPRLISYEGNLPCIWKLRITRH